MPLVTVVGAIGAVFLAVAAWKQATIARQRHEEQTKADRERRITESFAKAAEQLGSDKLEARLGAIYTLERLAYESEREYGPVMEALTAYVREHAPWPPRQSDGAADQEKEPKLSGEPEPSGKRVRPATDVQAILTVLGRRAEEVRNWESQRLDLSATDLRGTDLRGAHLEGAYLYGAHLEGAELWDAHLEGANLWDTHLEGANLHEAQLEGANLWRAHLEGAKLWDAHLEGARKLTQAQINSALGDENTTLPEGLERPAHWAEPLEPPS